MLLKPRQESGTHRMDVRKAELPAEVLSYVENLEAQIRELIESQGVSTAEEFLKLAEDRDRVTQKVIDHLKSLQLALKTVIEKKEIPIENDFEYDIEAAEKIWFFRIKT